MGLKNRSRFSSTLDIELKRQLEELANKTRIPASKLLDEAIEDLMDKYKDEIKKD